MIDFTKYDKLFNELFPLNRSITGPGIRNSLRILQKYLPLEIKSIKTGTRVFDWTVPKEWHVNNAYIILPNGEKICEFEKSNLHLVNFSIPVNKKVSFDELLNHLHYNTDLPDAVPYVTSYYKENWGFCISYNQLLKLPKKGLYKVFIDSKHISGYLNYGEVFIS